MVSVAQTVAIPTKFVKEIDKFVESGEYGSRADFVSTALRYYYSFLMNSMAKYYAHYDAIRASIEKKNPKMSEKNFFRQVAFGYMKTTDLKDYDDGKRTNVLIRLPPKFSDAIDFIAYEYFDSRHDFYRKALEYYSEVSNFDRDMFTYYECDDVDTLMCVSPWPEATIDKYLEDIDD